MNNDFLLFPCLILALLTEVNVEPLKYSSSFSIVVTDKQLFQLQILGAINTEDIYLANLALHMLRFRERISQIDKDNI